MKKFALASAVAGAAIVGALLIPAAAQAAPAAPALSATSAWEVERGVIVDGDVSSRTTEHPQGGTWNYGTRGFVITDTYSDFLHNSRKHGSSAGNGNGDFESSKATNPKAWSKASVHHTFVGNVAYYRFS